MIWMYRIIMTLALFSYGPFLQGQANNIQWIMDLTDEVLNESDHCERCTWVSPTITQIKFAGEAYFFFRYSCAIDQAFSRMYSVSGDVVGECTSDGDDLSCFGSDAFTIFTFAEDITKVWTCSKGFECGFTMDNNIDQQIPIAIDDSRCAEGIKQLTVSADFTDFLWSGPGIESRDNSIEVDRSAVYHVTVTDSAGCVFTGESAIEISSIEVKIKGQNRFCHGETTQIGVSGFVDYIWSTGSIDSTLVVDTGGTYQVTVVNDLDCEGVGSFDLVEDLPLSLEIIVDRAEVTEGDTVSVTYSSDQAAAVPVEFQWSGMGTLMCMQCSSATFIPLLNNALTLSVEDDKGCLSSTSTTVAVKDLDLDIYVPNAVHCSSQFGNDRFMVFGGRSIKHIDQLAIYDRWGSLVFLQREIKANDKDSGWNGYSNGVLHAEAIYSYVAELVFINGRRKSIIGDFMLFH